MKKLLGFFKNILHRFWLSLKDEPRKVSAILIGANSLLQLALSQIHIKALVRVKLTVSDIGASNFTAGMPSMGIGMFNFLFILFGLATIFNAIRATNIKRSIVALFFIGLTIFLGEIYILKATNPDSLTDYADVSSSIVLMYVGFAIYAVGALFIVYNIFKMHRKV